MSYSQFQQPLSAHYQYKPYVSGRNRARLVTILLIAGAVVSLLTIPSHILDLAVQPFGENQEIADNPAGFLALALTAVLGLATVAVYLATIIVFLMWLYRVSNNVGAFGKRTQNSSGWAVGSFFVPIVNLFVPYISVKDIWAKSEPIGADPTGYSLSPPGFFPAWWGFWIASNISGNAYFRMTMAEAPIEASSIVGILSEVLSIAAAFFAIKVVREIDRRQEERAQNLAQAYPTPPPPPAFENREAAPLVTESAAPTSPVATSPLTEPQATANLAQPPDASKNS